MALPFDPTLEANGIEAIRDTLKGFGIAPHDQVDFIVSRYARWRQGEGLDPSYSRAIAAGMTAGDARWGIIFARHYFRLHHEVLRSKHLCTFDEATALLSHLRFVMQMIEDERMSAAQVAKLIRARDRRIGIGWRALQEVVAALGRRISISVSEADQLCSGDRSGEEALFADAGFEEAAAIAGEIGSELGFGDGLEELLLRIFSPDPSGDRHGPYLQLLHVPLITAHFFDHSLKHVYEFSPRGVLGQLVHDQYPGSLRTSELAYLNNAKSVDALDEGWARSKEDHLAAAVSVYEIIDRLEDMPFLARRELASALRRWLYRIIRLVTPRSLLVRVPTPAQDIKKLLDEVRAGPTGTFGVIEQRVTDAVAVGMFPESLGWRAYGVGDSVNASNASRKKLGDCEFVRPGEIIAFEAHAGNLTDTYVDRHIEGLKRVLRDRKAGLTAVAAATAWQVEICFLSHGAAARSRNVTIEGFNVKCLFKTYAEFLAGAPTPAKLKRSYDEHVANRLNEPRTPESVRRRYLQIIAK